MFKRDKINELIRIVNFYVLANVSIYHIPKSHRTANPYISLLINPISKLASYIIN